MDGMSGVNIVSDRHALSPLTLALLEDSGWYAVNWDNAVSRYCFPTAALLFL